MSTSPGISASSSRVPAFAFALLAATWLAGLVAAPWAIAHVASRNLLSEAGALVYLAGGFLCHQRPDRSFHAWGIQLPVCARCFGIYAGAALGSGLKLASFRQVPGVRSGSGQEPPLPDLTPAGGGKRPLPDLTPGGLALAAVPTLLSVGLEAAGLWAQTPLVRCIAALSLGFAVAWFVAAHAAEAVGGWRNRRGL